MSPTTVILFSMNRYLCHRLLHSHWESKAFILALLMSCSSSGERQDHQHYVKHEDITESGVRLKWNTEAVIGALCRGDLLYKVTSAQRHAPRTSLFCLWAKRIESNWQREDKKKKTKCKKRRDKNRPMKVIHFPVKINMYSFVFENKTTFNKRVGTFNVTREATFNVSHCCQQALEMEPSINEYRGVERLPDVVHQ